MDNLQEIIALWDKYHYSIATNTMEYDRELRQLLFANSNVCDVSDINVGELISKRQAIDASIEAVNSWNKSCSIGQQKRIENYINKLPSAQPEIIRCKDCKYWVPGYITDNDDFIPPKCKEWQQMVGHSSDDYCSLAERREVTT